MELLIPIASSVFLVVAAFQKRYPAVRVLRGSFLLIALVGFTYTAVVLFETYGDPSGGFTSRKYSRLRHIEAFVCGIGVGSILGTIVSGQWQAFWRASQAKTK